MALSVLLTIQACSGPLDLLTGGGVNTAANTQVGRENTQTIGTSTQQKFAPNQITVATPTTTLRESVRPQSRPAQTPKIEQVQNQTNNELPTWVWIMFALIGAVGLLTDTPSAIFERRRLVNRIKELEKNE